MFGKSLFEVRKTGIDLFVQSTQNEAAKSKFLPDFNRSQNDTPEWIVQSVAVDNTTLTTPSVKNKKGKKVEKEKVPVVQFSPKKVYELKLLHDETFKLNTDEKYVDAQVSDFKDKLKMIKSEEYDMRRGVDEIASVIIRFENRKKYADVKGFFEEFPYTTTSKINGVIGAHSYLKLGQIAQFIADMPKEAVEIMKKYNANTDKVCGKQAVFYIIANKDDFKKSEKRRDPILLAQSPFGHFWQILGAWDKEMLMVEEL